MGFALFFLGENGNIIFMSALITILFCGGGLPLFDCLSDIPYLL
jgi:NADH-quinone oxidoreductase subunit H